MSGFVIVGASLAGAKAAEALRDQGYEGALTLIGTEPDRPYARPELSKGYLAGKTEREKVFVHDADWYAEHDVDLRLGVTATAIDRAAHRVDLADGSSIDYAKLLIATGARSRQLPCRGPTRRPSSTCGRSPSPKQIADRLATAKKLVVIGAGWIGLEVTAAARDAGVEVTVVESAELPLLRVLGPELAEVFAGLHREHGVDFRFGATVAAITETGIQLADGTDIAGDAVLIAIGAAPNVELAEAAGLTVDNGIVVDDALAQQRPRHLRDR